jgi:ATP synthase protein I
LTETETFKPWSAEQARTWRSAHLPISPWRVIFVQMLVGLICCVVVGIVMQSASAVWSAVYGVLVVLVPSILLVWGMTGWRVNSNPLASVSRFMFWSVVKLCMSTAMLVVAVKVVPNLNWLVLLAVMFICIKVNWVAFLWRPRRVKNKVNQYVS